MLSHGEYKWKPEKNHYQMMFHQFICQDYHGGPVYWLSTINDSEPFPFIIVSFYNSRQQSYDYFRSIEFASSTGSQNQLGVHYFASFREMAKDFEPVGSKNNLH